MSDLIKAAKALLAVSADFAEKFPKEVDELKMQIALEEAQPPQIDQEGAVKVLAELRDMVGKGWTDVASKYVEDILSGHASLGVPMKPFPYVGAFEQSFLTAARKHNVIAAFVVVEVSKANDPEDPGKMNYKLITGGHHIADQILSFHLRPLANELGVSIGPKKAYLDIKEIEQRNPVHPQGLKLVK
jgi:hypothetical protein